MNILADLAPEELSTAERLSLLTEQQRTDSLADLTDSQLEDLLYDWAFWGRPDQQWPDEPWSILLNLGGRGSGKTRGGAELTREAVKRSDRPLRIGFFAPTPFDARVFMIEGEAGILAVSPPSERPIYEPAKRELTWPNGSKALIFTGAEPDSGRGPTLDFAWADELCLVAGTMVQTDQGAQPIETLRPGRQVWTRKGLRSVRRSGLTSLSEQIYELRTDDGRVLRGTSDHPVWVVGKGWTPLSASQPGDTLYPWESRPIASIGVDGAGISHTRATTRTAKVDSCTERFTGRTLAHYPQIGLSITSTTTNRTTTPRIFKPCPSASMCVTTASGAQPPPVAQHDLKCVSETGANVSNVKSNALNAADCFGAVERAQSFVIRTAPPASDAGGFRLSTSDLSAPGFLQRDEKGLTDPASGAEDRSGSNSPGQSPAPRNAHMPVVVSCGPTKQKRAVYNLEVEGAPEFFAEGILVHNCKWTYMVPVFNNMRMALRGGDNPKTVITTTPKPLELIKQIVSGKYPGTVVRRASLYRNIANLAPSFIREMLEVYEGTTLGKQELHGEIIEDTEGALWRMAMIEPFRVAEAPRLARIVVGVDPSNASTLGTPGMGRECGIVVAGRGYDGRGYVLDDRSLHATPGRWGMEAALAYLEWNADALIVEDNFGGATVRQVMKTVQEQILRLVDAIDQGTEIPDEYEREVAARLHVIGQRAREPVQITPVPATRGKKVRAEGPVGLYEQQRISHVGTFPLLEQQMTTWVPPENDSDGKGTGYSPDRIDALVWAIFSLMLIHGPASISSPVGARIPGAQSRWT